MTLSEVLAALREEGLSVTGSRITYARLTGKIGTVPTDGANNAAYSEEHLQRLREYFAAPRRCGRPPKKAVASNV